MSESRRHSGNIIEIDLSMEDDDDNDIIKLQENPGSPRAEAETTEIERSFIKFLSYCATCNEHMSNRDSKLLPCLHTFCMQCLNIDLEGNTYFFGVVTINICLVCIFILDIYKYFGAYFTSCKQH